MKRKAKHLNPESVCARCGKKRKEHHPDRDDVRAYCDIIGYRRFKGLKGFSTMTPEQRLRIATLGGLAVSRDRRSMSRIGKRGGEKTQARRKAARRDPATLNPSTR